MISLVIPVHNEEGNIEPLYQEIKGVMDSLGEEYEIIYVNDGSTDGSGEILRRIKAQDPRVRVLEMDRNRGEAAALTAGFHHARGDIVVSMDGDGQNDPAYIPRLLEKLREGYKAVSGWREKRKEPFLTRVLPSRMANWIIGMVTGVRVHDNGCSLKAYRGEAVKSVHIPHGFHRFIPAIFGVKNNEVAEVKIKDRPRRWGSSHYGLSRTLEVLRELVTIPFILRGGPGSHYCLKVCSNVGLALLLLYLLFCLWVPRGFYFFPFPLAVVVASRVAYKNLERFLQAQKEGAFSVSEPEQQ